MAVLLLERASLYQFDEHDHLSMDIKPDVQTVKVLYRLGLIQTKSEGDAVYAAHRLNPEYPGAVDSALWRIGRQWCLARDPLCSDCVLSQYCQRQGF
jgi:endonuclease III